MREVSRPVTDNRSASSIFVNFSGSVPLGTENVLVGDGVNYNSSSTLRWSPFDVVYLMCGWIQQHIYKGDALR